MRGRGWQKAIRLNPAVLAWPFVVVILIQMAVGGISVYVLSTIRAYVTNESLWSKGQHEAIYFLNVYLDTRNPRDLESFNRAIAIPLAYRRARRLLDTPSPDRLAVRRSLLEAGALPEDIPGLIWMFRTFRTYSHLARAVALWEEADHYIIELEDVASSFEKTPASAAVAELRDRLEQIDAAMTPRSIAFSRELNEGARMVERLLMIANLTLAALLAGLTIWRVGRTLKQRRQIESELTWQASHDGLTGLLNRRALEDRLSRELKPSKDGKRATCALVVIDLDQFKIVNDTCGHAAGDALLRRICGPVHDLLGPNDMLARLGGDEFSIFLPNIDMTRALAVAESVRAAIERVDFLWQGRPFSVTASIGLVCDEAHAASPEALMRAADMACFMAKEKGRNRVHAHRKEDETLLDRMREMSWVQRIQEALSKSRFCLYAQEILALAHDDDRGIHLEVLVRLRDETGTLVPPATFLPAAERFGLVTLIDRWVVRDTFRILAERRTIPAATPIARCAINLSGATIGDDAFLDFLKAAFAEFDVPPQTICFEVTETSAIVNLDAARTFVHDLRGLGCTFALDDFGSGMSSFNYLKELPVDFLKIDGGFVRNLLTDRADRAMVEMISHVGHVMGKRIVAEFVETEALAHALREIGVDYGQGYGIAMPKPFHARFEGVAETLLRPFELYGRRIA